MYKHARFVAFAAAERRRLLRQGSRLPRVSRLPDCQVTAAPAPLCNSCSHLIGSLDCICMPTACLPACRHPPTRLQSQDKQLALACTTHTTTTTTAFECQLRFCHLDWTNKYLVPIIRFVWWLKKTYTPMARKLNNKVISGCGIFVAYIFLQEKPSTNKYQMPLNRLSYYNSI